MHDVAGERIGSVEQVFLDHQTGEPEWLRNRHRALRDEAEPVQGEAAPGEIGEDAIGVTLSEEQPVVEKQAVAKERIGIEKTVETETRAVGDSVRKERVEVDGTPEGE